MKKYGENQKIKAPKKEFKKSDVACDELKCEGEMMIHLPEKIHPELGLKRASCGTCKWKGWV